MDSTAVNVFERFVAKFCSSEALTKKLLTFLETFDFIWLSGINDLVVRKSVCVYIYHTDWRRCERVL